MHTHTLTHTRARARANLYTSADTTLVRQIISDCGAAAAAEHGGADTTLGDDPDQEGGGPSSGSARGARAKAVSLFLVLAALQAFFALVLLWVL